MSAARACYIVPAGLVAARAVSLETLATYGGRQLFGRAMQRRRPFLSASSGADSGFTYACRLLAMGS